MPNKHQIQKDFYTKRKEWIESYNAKMKDEQVKEKQVNAETNARYYNGEDR